MKKEEVIRRYGEEAYEKQLEQVRTYHEEHPEEVETTHHEQCHKDGKYYEKHLEYNKTGLQGERNAVRRKHQRQYKPYKDIIAPESQIHHEWIPQTAEYRGLALVEATPHQYGIIDVIQILDGEITLLTEAEILNQEPTIDIAHEDALALIHEIQAEKDNLGMEMVEWIDWSEEVVGMLCDLFDIEEPEVK